jgi:hypothetical protein
MSARHVLTDDMAAEIVAAVAGPAAETEAEFWHRKAAAYALEITRLRKELAALTVLYQHERYDNSDCDPALLPDDMREDEDDEDEEDEL